MRRVALAHWGAYEIGSDGSLRGTPTDPDPSTIGLPADALRSQRVLAPMVRRSWLDHGVLSHPERRGVDDLLPVEWDRALDIVAEAFETIRDAHGNESIFAGSYGWASAGRFHHAQSQLKRFLNCLGGYVDSVGTYSTGAAEVVAPRVTGLSEAELERIAPPLDEVVANTDLVVSFGGFPAGNTQVAGGGPTEHLYRPSLRALRDRGCRFVTIGPLRGGFDRELGAEWIPMRPGTDAAMMIGLASELVGRATTSAASAPLLANDLGPFLAYLRGDDRGAPRDATWAASICDVDADVIRGLATALGRRRSLVNATWSTQRTENGEQAVWSLLALGVVIGQMGRPGCGVAFGYGSMGSIGDPVVRPSLPALPRGANPVGVTIPVSRIADALESPGGRYMFDGASATYPDIRLVWWCGGNPFHHAQDLNRLSRAFTRPEAVIVNEPYLTATAARADVVLASTLGAERRDIGGASTGRHIVLTTPVGPPPGDARDDHEIFVAMARRLGVEHEFTGGRDPEAWMESFYEKAIANEPSRHPRGRSPSLMG